MKTPYRYLFTLLLLFTSLARAQSNSGGSIGPNSPIYPPITGVVAGSTNITVNTSGGVATIGLASDLTGVNSITASPATDLTLNAGSGNQNVVINNTGTGSLTFGTPNTTARATLTGDIYIFGGASSPTQHGGIEWQSSTTGAGFGLRMINASNSTGDWAIQTRSNNAAWISFVQVRVSDLVWFHGGTMIFNGATNNSNGLIQFGASTAAAQGIGFGADIEFFRSAAGELTMTKTSASGVAFHGREVSNAGFTLQSSSGAVTLKADLAASTMSFSTNAGATALTIGATQIIQLNSANSFSANGAVVTSLTGVGPTGSHTTVQKWLTIVDNTGATVYIPAF